MRSIILLVICYFFIQLALAQEYTVAHFTDENGLPQNSVKSIATDNAGFVWLATENGAVRYDGKKFLLFDKGVTKVSSNRIINFRKDINNNKLYAVTESFQLLLINNGTATFTNLVYDNVFHFTNATKDNTYFATGLPNFLGKFVAGIPYIIPNEANSFYRIFKGNIALYRNNQLIYNIAYNYKDQWRFFIINKKLYYLDENRKLLKFDNGKVVPLEINGNILPRTNPKSKEKLFWNNCTDDVFIGIDHTLYTLQIDKTRGTVTAKKILKDVNYNNLDILSVYLDKMNGDVYLGSYTKGLYIFKEKRFKSINPDTTSSNEGFYAQSAYGRNSILYANGFLFNSTDKFNRSDLLKKYSGNFTLLIDREKTIWTSKGSEIYQISPNLKKILKTYHLPTQINCIYESTANEIWLGGEQGIFKTAVNRNSFITVNELSNIKKTSYLKKGDDKLWIGTHSGLFYFDFKTHKKHEIKELLNKDIRSILIRGKETWITTYGDGFYLYMDNKLTAMPNDSHNYISTSHCIVEDNRGFFWISTNKGLFQASINDLLAFAYKKTSSVFYAYFDRSYGFNTNEFNGGCQPCGTVLNNGDFSFPTINGIVLFNPAHIIVEQPDKPIVIDKVIVDNKEIEHGSVLQVPIDFGRLVIYLSTPYFGNPENVSFEYKLSTQTQWIKSADQIIAYTSLPSGNNELLVRKMNGFGYQNYTYQKIHIFVPPHFYQTWWFILSLICLFFIFVYLFIKTRTKRIKRRNKLLEVNIQERTKELQSTIKAYETSQNKLENQFYFQRRLIAAITHDIKSPLRYLMMTGEALYKNKKHEPVDREGLKAIYTSSSQIYHFTDNLLEYAKGVTNEVLQNKGYFNLNDLVAEKIDIFQGIANVHAIKIHNLVETNIKIKSNKQLLSVILHNLLDNAVKFTSSGEISFSYQTVANYSKIIVKDSGKGMKPNQVDWCNEPNPIEMMKNKNEIDSGGGLGLIIVKELLQIIGGKINVEAVLGKGTTFEITLKNEV